MLRGIPGEISPDLMYAMMNMGHGDELVIGDGNFPAASSAKLLIRADGHGVPAILQAIMRFFVLDTYVDDHAVVMQPSDAGQPAPPIWGEYRRILEQAEGRQVHLTPIDRFDFYERARRAFCIVASGETAIYANLILKKGVI